MREAVGLYVLFQAESDGMYNCAVKRVERRVLILIQLEANTQPVLRDETA